MGARAVGLWVGEQKPLGKTPLRGNPSPEITYLPTSKSMQQSKWLMSPFMTLSLYPRCLYVARNTRISGFTRAASGLPLKG